MYLKMLIEIFFQPAVYHLSPGFHIVFPPKQAGSKKPKAAFPSRQIHAESQKY